jgi:hypothetical protein
LKRFMPARATTVEALLAEVVRLRETVEQTNAIVQQMNHELHHGGDSGLPLLVDLADRSRTDAATVTATAHAMERSLSTAVTRLEDVAERLGR